jgi:hypothetical protein
LNFINILLECFLFLQALHDEIGQLLGKILPLLSLRLDTSLHFANCILKDLTLLLPGMPVGCDNVESDPIPNGLLADFELDDVLLNVD